MKHVATCQILQNRVIFVEVYLSFVAAYFDFICLHLSFQCLKESKVTSLLISPVILHPCRSDTEISGSGLPF